MRPHKQLTVFLFSSLFVASAFAARAEVGPAQADGTPTLDERAGTPVVSDPGLPPVRATSARSWWWGGSSGASHNNDDESHGSGDRSTLCHYPPGNPANARTITVGNEIARLRHLAHGDTPGPCPSDETPTNP